MGPGGELRYPSFSFQNPNLAQPHELGEFQCYDKVDLQFSLNYYCYVVDLLLLCVWETGDNQFA